MTRNEEFFKVKEIKVLFGVVLLYVAQAKPLIDAEIRKKGYYWTETSKPPESGTIALSTLPIFEPHEAFLARQNISAL